MSDGGPGRPTRQGNWRLGPFEIEKKVSVPSILTLLISVVALYAIAENFFFGPSIVIVDREFIRIVDNKCYKNHRFVSAAPYIEPLNNSSSGQSVTVSLDEIGLMSSRGDYYPQDVFYFHAQRPEKLSPLNPDGCTAPAGDHSKFITIKNGERYGAFSITIPRYSKSETERTWENAFPLDAFEGIKPGEEFVISVRFHVIADGVIDRLLRFDIIRIDCTSTLEKVHVDTFAARRYVDLAADCAKV